jgi:hypothetical protein
MGQDDLKPAGSRYRHEALAVTGRGIVPTDDVRESAATIDFATLTTRSVCLTATRSLGFAVTFDAILRKPSHFRKAVVKNDLDHLCDQLGMLGLLAECAASGCRGLGGLRVSRSLRVIFALMGRYPRCGRRDTAPVASRYDQGRRPKIRVIVAIFSYFFFGLAGLKRHLLNRSERRNGRFPS